MTRSVRTPLLGIMIALIVIAAFSLTSMQSAVSQVPTEPPGIPAGEVESERLSGDDRFETSVAISEEAFPSGAPDVFLARADDFPDSLSAGALTTGPVLLVPSCGDVPQVVLDEIERLSPTRVVALGGTAAVCDDVVEQAVTAAEGPQGTETPEPTAEPTATATPECEPFPQDPSCLEQTETPAPTETATS